MVNLRIIQEKNNNQLSIEGIELTPTSMKKIKKNKSIFSLMRERGDTTLHLKK